MMSWRCGRAVILRILLDSHAFVWFVQADRRCSNVARAAIEDPDAEVYVSAATAWEMSTKVRSGKWIEVKAVANQIERAISSFDFLPLPITVTHGRVAGSLPGAHKDPFDRILAAQAEIEGLVLVTVDPAFHVFGTRTLW